MLKSFSRAACEIFKHDYKIELISTLISKDFFVSKRRSSRLYRTRLYINDY